jgi:hypothetical protein
MKNAEIKALKMYNQNARIMRWWQCLCWLMQLETRKQIGQAKGKYK